MGERYLVREFNNLRQTGTVERYQEQFEDIRTQLLCYIPQLTEEYLISCYINGLKEESIPFMDIVHPNSLIEVFEQAKLHERALAVINRKLRINTKGPSYQYAASNPTKTTQSYNGPKGYTYNQQSHNQNLIEQ